jgi:hypothetical protein
MAAQCKFVEYIVDTSKSFGGLDEQVLCVVVGDAGSPAGFLGIAGFGHVVFNGQLLWASLTVAPSNEQPHSLAAVSRKSSPGVPLRITHCEAAKRGEILAPARSC